MPLLPVDDNLFGSSLVGHIFLFDALLDIEHYRAGGIDNLDIVFLGDGREYLAGVFGADNKNERFEDANTIINYFEDVLEGLPDNSGEIYSLMILKWNMEMFYILSYL